MSAWEDHVFILRSQQYEIITKKISEFSIEIFAGNFSDKNIYDITFSVIKRNREITEFVVHMNIGKAVNDGYSLPSEIPKISVFEDSNISGFFPKKWFPGNNVALDLISDRNIKSVVKSDISIRKLDFSKSVYSPPKGENIKTYIFGNFGI